MRNNSSIAASIPLSKGTLDGISPVAVIFPCLMVRVPRGSRPTNEYLLQRSPCSTDSRRNPSPSPTNLMNAATGVSKSARTCVHTGTTVCSCASAMNSSRLGVITVDITRHQMIGKNRSTHLCDTHLYLLDAQQKEVCRHHSRNRPHAQTDDHHWYRLYATARFYFDSSTPSGLVQKSSKVIPRSSMPSSEFFRSRHTEQWRALGHLSCTSRNPTVQRWELSLVPEIPGS